MMNTDTESQMKQALDIVRDGLWIIDRDFQVTYANEALCKMLNTKKSELIGKRCYEVFSCPHSDPVSQCRLSEVPKMGQKELVESIPCQDIAQKYRMVARPFKDSQGNVIGIIEYFVPLADGSCQKEPSLWQKIVGKSPAMQQVFQLLQNVAASDVSVMLLGETGTGKEIAARTIHYASNRREKPFIAVNCPALSESIIESELFGHVKGAFTGALKDKAGRFEAANGGTIFLDEIAELPLPVQAKLLRILQERQLERVGECKTRDIDVRIIAATNRDPAEMTARGCFREDLYYRLNVFPVTLPPLRERLADLPLLVEYFLDRELKRQGKEYPLGISEDLESILMDHSWPGNIRELENVIKYSLVLCRDEGVITKDHIPPYIIQSSQRKSQSPKEKKKLQQEQQEKEALLSALRASNYNKTKTAEMLGISRVTVWNRMKKYDLL